MTKKERETKLILKETKQLIMNVKHWLSWLEQEDQSEKQLAQVETLKWVLGNMSNCKKLQENNKSIWGD